MLPPTSTGRSCARKSSPVSAVVVVLPLVPVIAMTSASIARQASSSSPTIAIPRARTRESAGIVSGTPGLTTTSSAPSNAASGCPPVHSRPPSRSSARASSDSAARSPASDARTRPPTRRTSRAAATPLFARPTTDTVLPASHRRYAGPRPVAPLISSSSSWSQLAAALSIPARIPCRSPELQRREREERQHERDDPEPNDDLRLGPALHLVVMVQRGHPEHAPARELERRDLDDDRARLDDVDPADQRQEQLRLGEHRQRAERAAERQRAHVAHEHLRGIAVEPQEAERRADERAAEDRELARALHVQDAEVLGRLEVAGQVRDD